MQTNRQGGEIYSRNSFETLANLGESAHIFTRDALDKSGDWNVVVNDRNLKRQRISTGSQNNSLFISKEEFKHLSMDDKLITMFNEWTIWRIELISVYIFIIE